MEFDFWSTHSNDVLYLGRRELFQSTPLSKRARIEIDVSPVVPGRNEENTGTLCLHTFYITFTERLRLY